MGPETAERGGPRCGARSPCRNDAFRSCALLTSVSARTGPIRLTKARMSGNCGAGSEKEGGRGRGSRRFPTEKRPRTVPSEGVSREPFPRCLRDLGEWRTGGRRGGRGRRPEAVFRRKPPRDRAPRADGEAAGACRTGRGGDLGPPGKSARAGVVRQRGSPNHLFAAHDPRRIPRFGGRTALRAPSAHPPPSKWQKTAGIGRLHPESAGAGLSLRDGSYRDRALWGTEHPCASLDRPETSESGENVPSEPSSEAGAGRRGRALLVGRLSKGVLVRHTPALRLEPSDATALLKTLW